ncbi:telomerase-binding protein EST1A-like isoform X2 [Oratosquilla oratoria]|uniref:telomerase-binding protein EST1A-like isoform X2 n=1 Tax=Oratosquilla oratoria TaxID=337810 RepID=UPI003F76AC33
METFEDNKDKSKERRKKREDIVLYRPGALRQLKLAKEDPKVLSSPEIKETVSLPPSKKVSEKGEGRVQLKSDSAKVRGNDSVKNEQHDKVCQRLQKSFNKIATEKTVMGSCDQGKTSELRDRNGDECEDTHDDKNYRKEGGRSGGKKKKDQSDKNAKILKSDRDQGKGHASPVVKTRNENRKQFVKQESFSEVSQNTKGAEVSRGCSDGVQEKTEVARDKEVKKNKNSAEDDVRKDDKKQKDAGAPGSRNKKRIPPQCEFASKAKYYPESKYIEKDGLAHCDTFWNSEYANADTKIETTYVSNSKLATDISLQELTERVDELLVGRDRGIINKRNKKKKEKDSRNLSGQREGDARWQEDYPETKGISILPLSSTGEDKSNKKSELKNVSIFQVEKGQEKKQKRGKSYANSRGSRKQRNNSDGDKKANQISSGVDGEELYSEPRPLLFRSVSDSSDGAGSARRDSRRTKNKSDNDADRKEVRLGHRNRSRKNTDPSSDEGSGLFCPPRSYSREDGVLGPGVNEDEDWYADEEKEGFWAHEDNDNFLAKSERKDEKSGYSSSGKRCFKENFASDSPGKRGGLIQLPSNAGDSTVTQTGGAHQRSSSTTPLPQKQLFNPNNPSKPVMVIPSARDLPPTQREQHSDASRGQNKENSGQWGTFPIEGSGMKVDPSLLYNIQKGEMDISYYVSSNQLPMEFRRIMDIRLHLQGCYKQLLISDIKVCQEKNIENNLWKHLYYIIIEKLREYIATNPALKEKSLGTMFMIIDDGLRYLQDLLEGLQHAYRFKLEDHLEDEGVSSSGSRSRVRMALVSAQKILLSLGDLTRYKEQYSSIPNYNVAKRWYLKAQQVYPRNGRPFNQLAIIAVNQKRPLDVVYYYVRSLMASNPFMSAKDSLINMFDDIRKKYESNQHRDIKGEEMAKETDMRRTGGEGLRQELWIRPDSGAMDKRTLSQSEDAESVEEGKHLEELRKLQPDQLMKRFLTSYLHCHGKLFSCIGLETFGDLSSTMLREFYVLMRTTPPRLSTQHLLQIMAINMYAIANTQLRADNLAGSTYRSASQELALLLAQEMFGLLTEVVVELIPHHLRFSAVTSTSTPPGSSSAPPASSSAGSKAEVGSVSAPSPSSPVSSSSPGTGEEPDRLFTPTLAAFIPPVKAWCDWLMYHSSVWNPPPHSLDPSRGNRDPWGSVAELATILRGLNQLPFEIYDEGGPDLTLVRLEEDVFLRGFEPLLGAHRNQTHVPNSTPLCISSDAVRLSRVQTVLVQFLCGVDPPVLRLRKTDRGDVIVSVVDTSPPVTPVGNKLSSSTSDVDDDESYSDDASDAEDELEMEDSGEAAEGDTPLASTVRLLARRKKMLEKKQRMQRKLQNLLEGAVTVHMEIRPRYLVPDTNCFIEHLHIIQTLVNNSPYTVMVPLVVLNELDGLSRDAAVEKYGSVGHALRVREGAALALEYLRSTRSPALKCVTSQGSVLTSTTFTAEMDLNQDSTNDDKILMCCLHFCSQGPQKRPLRDGVRRLYREVVLLTDDRNLRVKAHAQDVPVRDLTDFTQWAGVR